MERIPITSDGYMRLEAELKQLKSVERPAVIKAIAEAREHGDLSENAEYSSAREKQSFLEGRISELDARLSRAEVIDPKSMSGSTVKFGAIVLVVDEATDEESTFQLVGEYEAIPEEGKIFIGSPIAKSLIGKSEGDIAKVALPAGTKSYEILRISYE